MTPVPSGPIGQMVEPGSCVEHLLNYVRRGNFRRVFIFSGQRSFFWFEANRFVEELLKFTAVMRLAEVRPNPDFDSLRLGVEAVSKHDPDIIIGIGGGSVLDLAKLSRALRDNPTVDPATLTTDAPHLNVRTTQLVLVPTTAGSGAEATHFAVLYRDGIKHSVAGESLLADHIVLDSALVRRGEPQQLAASGLDALCQCIESLWARAATVESRKTAYEGLVALSSSLVGMVRGDKRLAEPLLWGSHMGGRAINVSKTTAPHALSYYLTSHFGVPHGIAVASTIGHFIDHFLVTIDRNGSVTQYEREAASSIRRALELKDNQTAVDYFHFLFLRLGLQSPQLFWPREPLLVEAWLRSANQERLQNHPLSLDPEDLPKILGLR